MALDGWFEAWLAKRFDMSRTEFRSQMERKTLHTATVSLSRWSSSCRYNCKHCFMEEPKEWYNPMDKVTVEQLLASNHHVNHTKTFLYPHDLSWEDDFLQLLERFPQSSVEGNPALFIKHPDFAQRIWDLGVRELDYSLHGMPAEHYALTGQTPKQWHEIVEGLHFAGEIGFEICLNTCATKKTIDHIEELGEIINSIPGLIEWWVLRLIPVGRARLLGDDWFYYGDECGIPLRRFAKVFLQIDKRIQCNFPLAWGPNFFHKVALQLLGRYEWDPLTGIWNCHIPSDVMLGRRNLQVSRITSRCYPCTFAYGSSDLTIATYSDGKFHYSSKLMAELQPENRLGKLPGRCSPEVCPFTSICVGCPAVSLAFAHRKQPTGTLSLNQALDFCISRFIYEHRHDEALMTDLAYILEYPPIS